MPECSSRRNSPYLHPKKTQYFILRSTLAKFYPDELSIRRLIDDAGIDPLFITVSPTASAINNWHVVLTEAEKIGRINDLLSIVANEYGGYNKEFREVCDTYQQLLSQPAHTDWRLYQAQDKEQYSFTNGNRNWWFNVKKKQVDISFSTTLLQVLILAGQYLLKPMP